MLYLNNGRHCGVQSMWGTYAASQYHHPPPDSRLKERPYPNEKFFIFFYKNKVMVSIEKNQTFSFYIFFFL